MAPLGGKLIVFGGQSHSPPGQTWSFDGTDWTSLNVSGPSSRYGSVMAPLGGKVVLFVDSI